MIASLVVLVGELIFYYVQDLKLSQVSASAFSSSLIIQRIKSSKPKQEIKVVRKQLEDLMRSYSIVEHISK
jgi:hypothetical protein